MSACLILRTSPEDHIGACGNPFAPWSNQGLTRGDPCVAQLGSARKPWRTGRGEPLATAGVRLRTVDKWLAALLTLGTLGGCAAPGPQPTSQSAATTRNAAHPELPTWPTPRLNLNVFPVGAKPTVERCEAESRGAGSSCTPELAIRHLETALWASCALLEDQSVWCWGEPHSGTSGPDDSWPRQMPIADVSKLVGAYERFFAVTAQGALHYWGSQGKDGKFDRFESPRRWAERDVLDVAASWNQFCVLPADHRISCWDIEGYPSGTLHVPGAQRIVMSSSLACTLDGNGDAACWRSRTETRITLRQGNVAEMVAGGDAVCALLQSGQVRCWRGPNEDRPLAKRLGSAVKHLTGSPDGICALTEQGAQCVPLPSGGDRDQAVALAQEVLPQGVIPSSVSMGADHACATADGVGWCWGKDNLFGRLGQPDLRFDEPALVRVSLGDLAALHHVKDVAVGDAHRCVLVDDGTLRCWGENAADQLGLPIRRAYAGPMVVGGLHDVSKVTAFGATTCALLNDGSLYCFGQLPWRADLAVCGTSTSGPPLPCSTEPNLVAREVADMGLGAGFGCLVGRDRKVYCWGKNDLGQLGTGDLVDSSQPRPVVTATGKTLAKTRWLSVASAHACSILESGTLYCWGNNAPFEQGRPYNTPPHLSRATPLLAPRDVQAVNGQCLWSKSSGLWCWGHAFEDERAFTYEPRRMGRCQIDSIGSDPSLCYTDQQGVHCLGWSYLQDGYWHNGQLFSQTGPLSHLTGNGSERCAIDGKGELHCWTAASSELRTLVGRIPAQQLPWPQTDCTSDSPPSVLPRFPPLAPERVVLQEVRYDGGEGAELNDVATLNPKQVERLIELLNAPENYTSSVTCHDEHHRYSFRDKLGREQAVVEVGDECSTLVADPHIPAQHRLGGNIVNRPLLLGLSRLCAELGLKDCPPHASPDGKE